MEIVLHPRIAGPNQLRVWLGAFQCTAPPPLTWTVNGVSQPSAKVQVLRPLASARPGTLVSAGTPRAFTGVFQFTDGVRPGVVNKVEVRTAGGSAVLETKPVPKNLDAPGSRFNVLLVSCFHSAEDRGGIAGLVVSQLSADNKPDVVILGGDQVYLDLPTLKNFKNNVAWLANDFEEKYVNNWSSQLGYHRVISAAPGVSIPDDHEYWNNYPQPATLIQNSWTQDGRDNWEAAARLMYEAFQLPVTDGTDANPSPFRLGDPFQFDVPPLSFFMADIRSLRSRPGRQFSMTASARARLKKWVSQVVADPKITLAAFASGQPVFHAPAGALKGNLADFALQDYDDFAEIYRGLRTLVDAGKPVLCLTGDVHYGRVAFAIDKSTHRKAFHEVISSPTSLVSVVGLDSIKDFFGGLIGRNPWPRHGKAAAPPDFLADDIRFHNETLFPQTGNHAALLSFTRNGSGVDCRVTYFPMHEEFRFRTPQQAPVIEFNPL